MPRVPVTSQLVEPIALRRPFWETFAVFRTRTLPFLLDSASDPEKLGRFSFMGSDPFLVFRAKRMPAPTLGSPKLARCTVTVPRTNEISECVANPFAELRRLMAEHAPSRDALARSHRPVPLLAGAVGYFGFEANAFIEALPDSGSDDLGLPDIHVGFYDAMLVHCHRTGISYVSSVGRGNDERAASTDARNKRDELFARIQAFDRAPPAVAPSTASHTSGAMPTRVPDASVVTVVSEPNYCELVTRVQEHIVSGDLFELCLTHRMESPFEGDPWALYCELRHVNPAPFACFLELPEASIVCSSPERFLALGLDRVAESRPIKGTRRRGESAEEDRALHDDLQASEKDQAENNMIVDLVRSDFGRVCKFGSVHVPELRIIERYATLHQMVSTIRGELAEGRDAIDLLTACFPGGSMTGAPKIQALKVIDALEPVKRSVYSGAIGYLDFSGAMDLAIVIRTIIVKERRAFYNVGGAIVADSVPKDEYQETLDKAHALVRALAACRGRA